MPNRFERSLQSTSIIKKICSMLSAGKKMELNFHARLGTHEHENGAASLYSGSFKAGYSVVKTSVAEMAVV